MVANGDVDVLISPYSSGTSAKVAKAVNGTVPVLVWGGASESIYAQGLPNVFGTFTTSKKYMQLGMQTLHGLGAKTVMLVRNSKSFSAGVCAGARETANAFGMEIIADLKVFDNGTDIKSQLNAAGGEPDLLIGCGHLTDIKTLVLELPNSTVSPTAILSTQVGTTTFTDEMEAAGQKELGCGLFMPTQWKMSESTAADPVIGWTSAQFYQSFSSLTGAPPSYQTASAGGMIVALANAIDQAGGIEDMAAVMKAFKNLDIQSFYGRLKFAEDGSMNGKPMFVVQNNAKNIPQLVAPEEVAEAELRYPEVCPPPPVAIEVVIKEKEGASIVIPVLITLGAVAGLIGIASFIHWLRKLSKDRKRLKQEMEVLMQEKLRKAKATVSKLQHPMICIRLDHFLGLTSDELHTNYEGVRNMGKLIVLDTTEDVNAFKDKGNRIVFYSYQWLSWHKLGPNEIQHQCMIASIKQVVEKNGWDPSTVHIWLDILSIPQVHDSIKLLAVYSLYAFVKHATSLIIVTPPSKHEDTGEVAGAESYKQRAWTRAEQFAYFCEKGMQDIYHVEDTQTLKHISEDWMKSVSFVFEGNMTCCRLNHHNGTTPCDKESLVLPLVGLYHELCMKEQDGKLSAQEKHALSFIKADEARTFPAKYSYNTGHGDPVMRTLFGDLIQRAKTERVDKESRKTITDKSVPHSAIAVVPGEAPKKPEQAWA
eukprot:gnl/MRDRNA2_/MRDRNA2_84785_c0_seq1.p1 gnl/MRDRNA2_/MRDRNA2_84785_c0~~gnl/MRDRNA2_/MRDRNA2_84785_c0_seq1.p1  ORF type:complete len:802 (-),score=151.33 gnl/MRDRNA2_/MRDRNA2_84785_c0_seq1:26-2143(-)